MHEVFHLSHTHCVQLEPVREVSCRLLVSLGRTGPMYRVMASVLHKGTCRRLLQKRALIRVLAAITREEGGASRDLDVQS